ncbi:cytochrome c3 family protein [Archaeoglobus veneficus]|uniref:Tetrahaem cytochrome domain-containing protein n=1 Tax=Archaeoglobus veneficus (strain DSM 11195 / SNP6) TaxID=693661 RepID=F2KNB7_ARCVS|nr:cytochrome c3 family protein [Archaeoglobus veneficus]AEA47319.1 hypothetical protein Arcve_1313 [Archaeoglobus veneficus SNP6]
MRGILVAILVIIVMLIHPVAAIESSCMQCHESVAVNYSKSLHYTIEGIKTGFQQGSGKTLGIDVPAYCLDCHVENCTECHKVHKQLPNMTDCVNCHKDQIGVNYIGYLAEMMKKAPHADVHYKKGFECLDCHSLDEVHGDGNAYTFGEQAVKITCEDCHIKGLVVDGKKATPYDPNILAHKLHRDISCFACHADYYQTCSNCHLDTGEFDKLSTDEFHILRYNGLLYPAHVMTTSYEGKTSKSAGTVMPHTITAKARDCEECHDKEKEVFLVGFDGRLVGPPGVELADPPSKLAIDLSSFGINFKVDITQLGTLIILAVLGGIAVHLAKRRITLGRWVG